MKPKWDLIFLELAQYFADRCSKDPRTKVGAVIADGKRVVSLGYNGFPAGVDDDEDRYADSATKHLFVAHAERNALDNYHGSVAGCTLYVPLLPCNECAKSIIQKRIARVVTYYPDRDGTRFNWEATKTMFKEAGVQLDIYERPINNELSPSGTVQPNNSLFKEIIHGLQQGFRALLRRLRQAVGWYHQHC